MAAAPIGRADPLTPTTRRFEVASLDFEDGERDFALSSWCFSSQCKTRMTAASKRPKPRADRQRAAASGQVPPDDGGRFAVVCDRDALAKLLARVITARFRGVAAGAAVAGIPSWLSTRIRQKREGRLKLKYVRKLRALLAPVDRLLLDASLVSPYVLDLRRTHIAWLGQQLKRSTGMPGWRFLPDKGHEWVASDGKAAQIDRIEHAIQLRRRAAHVLGLDPLMILARSAPTHLLGEYVSKGRVLLAWSRVIAPLLDSAESGFAEPDARCLTDDEFCDFLWHGIAGEQILLDAYFRLPLIPGVTRAQVERAGRD